MQNYQDKNIIFRMKKISIIGAGSWGTTLAILLGKKGNKVKLWARRKEIAQEINKKKENKQTKQKQRKK